jgi:tetratricopeptide (TPR) repeat protein
MDDTADLFAAPAGAEGSGSAAARPPETGFDDVDGSVPGGPDDDGDSIATTIQNLIERGRAAFDANDQPLAISLWSRIFLIKPTHPEAGHLIETAKRSLADAESQVENLLSKARDAFDEGEHDAARLLINKALARRPNHIDVHILKEELDREQGVAAAPPAPPAPRSAPTAPELPELDDDLFGDAAAEGPDAAPAAAGSTAVDDAFAHDLFHEADDTLHEIDDFHELSLLDRLRSRLPLRLVAIAVVALMVVLAGVWLGGKFLSPEPEVDDSAAVSAVLVEADRLFKERKVEEALHLLREFPSSGLSQQRIEMRIAKYEESLAPPTPTPVPEQATRAQSLLDQGLWWAAYATAGEGLEIHPDDTGLQELRALVAENEPEAPLLDHALKTKNFRTAVSITEDLLTRYPGQGDLQMVLERSLFNSALAESRAYNLTGAENHLTRLLELKPEDEEAIRFLEFVQKYKVVAADMRLEIFIRSMNER